jgi:hypothetical protein
MMHTLPRRPIETFARLAFAALTSLISLAAACSNETIYLARIPENDAGAPTAPQKCVDSSSCPTGYYCDLPECGALTGGTCELPPPTCPPIEDPYCGCDRLTYFNDCLRRANGVPSSTRGPCLDFGLPCGGPPPGGGSGPTSGPMTCPEGALCAQLGGSMHGTCDHPIPGNCWVLPANCATTTAPFDYWDSCGGVGGACLDTCDAIRAGGAYRRAQNCP